MKELLNKTKKVIKENKKPIIIGGSVVALYMYSEFIWRKAFMAGGKAGFHATIDWFDKNFDNVNLRLLYEEWAKLNPDQIVK